MKAADSVHHILSCYTEHPMATTTTIRISEETRSTLRQLAEESGLSIQTVIDQALDVYRRDHFFASLDAAYDRLWNDPAARADELAERE